MARKFIATHRKTKLKVTLDEAGAADYRKKKLSYDIEEIPEKEKAAEPTEAKRAESRLQTDK